MTKTTLWLDELPLESSERELLLIGKSARPATGAIDANWQALCLALGTTAVATSAGASSLAANAVAGKVSISSSLVLSKATSTGLVAAAAKSLALGVAVGLAVMGAGALVEHSTRGTERPEAVDKTSVSPTHRQSAAPLPTPIAAPADNVAAPGTSQPGSSAAFAAPRERLAAAPPALDQPGEPPPTSTNSAPDKTGKADDTGSLARQARELAELKRLIDSGATSEALRRLDRNFSADATSALSEERDALYAQALDRAQRRDEARSAARRFISRYPHSPYVEAMRRLLAEE